MSTTSTVQMFYAGNFADMDTFEGNQTNEQPGNVLGTYDDLTITTITSVSEVDVDDDGVIYDDEFGTGDYLSYDTGGGTVNSALDSTSLYNADILLGDGSTMSVPVLVLQTANGDVFISEFPANPLDGLAIQSISLVSLNTSDASGINRGVSDVQGATIVCFATGTKIATQHGERSVETLKVGDKVMTLDHGLQPIRWIHFHDCPLDGVERSAKPLLIAAGSLGKGVPKQDLIVSPQHRIFVGGAGQLGTDFDDEALVPAKSMTALTGVRHMAGKRHITWVHFACDRHEVVSANGCLTESLLLLPMVLKGLTWQERRDLKAIFGSKTSENGSLNGPAARKCLPVQAVRKALDVSRSMKRGRKIRGQGQTYQHPGKFGFVASTAGKVNLQAHA